MHRGSSPRAMDLDLDGFAEDSCTGLADLDVLFAGCVDGEPSRPAEVPSPCRAAAADNLNVDSLAGDQPFDQLDALVQGQGEHANLARLCQDNGLLKRCPAGRCKSGKCLLRIASLRYDWLCVHAREAARLRAATMQKSAINMQRTHGGGEKKGAQVEEKRGNARRASSWIGDRVVDASLPFAGHDGVEEGDDRHGEYGFDDDQCGGAEAEDGLREDDEIFLYNKAVARVAREQFVVETVTHMLDPNFLADGDAVCSDAMLSVAYVSRNYLFRRPRVKNRKRRGVGGAAVDVSETPSRMEVCLPPPSSP